MVSTKRRQKINLQSKTVDGQKVRVCTRCIRSSSKEGFELKLGAKKTVGKRTRKGK
jgi:ribosomal protein L28